MKTSNQRTINFFKRLDVIMLHDNTCYQSNQVIKKPILFRIKVLAPLKLPDIVFFNFFCSYFVLQKKLH